MKAYNDNEVNKSRFPRRHPAALYVLLALFVILTTVAAANMVSEGPNENHA